MIVFDASLGNQRGIFLRALIRLHRALKKTKRTVGSLASGQTNEGGKSSLLHTDRECGIMLKKTLYGKDKPNERS